jgi:hypothetical protein
MVSVRIQHDTISHPVRLVGWLDFHNSAVFLY